MDGKKEGSEDGSRDELKVTRHHLGTASLHFTSHIHIQYHINLKINGYVREIYIYIYLLCAFNVFKSTLNELKIFIRTF